VARLSLFHSRAEMARLSQWLDEQELALAMPHRMAHAVRMCLEEAVVNLIDHTPATSAGPDISVDLGWQGDRMVAVIEDSGPPFDLRQAPLPARPKSLEDAIPGGLGILLIRSFASEINYTSESGHNQLILRFTLSAADRPLNP